ncbi:MAG TPA: chain length determinant protein tyrosine kinase EpsG [Gallionella sp.]|nr:chain length determinant protein tyrosine kinase EpsG [Gallionella sp.]
MQIAPEILRDRTIGSILLDAGKLSTDKVTQVLEQQKNSGLSFGETAIQLGMVAREDVQHALAQQYDYAYLPKNNSAVSPDLLAAYAPFSDTVEALRATRTQLMQKRFTGPSDKKSLAIVSPATGEGKSFIAANLAIVFSHLGKRTLLIDANMRTPSQHRLFKLTNSAGLSSILAGRSNTQVLQHVASIANLSVLTAGPTPPNPQELISRPAFGHLLDSVAAKFEVILIDTPSSSEFADANILSAAAGAAVTVVRKNHTRVEQLHQHLGAINSAGAETMGLILNEY